MGFNGSDNAEIGAEYFCVFFMCQLSLVMSFQGETACRNEEIFED